MLTTSLDSGLPGLLRFPFFSDSRKTSEKELRVPTPKIVSPVSCSISSRLRWGTGGPDAQQQRVQEPACFSADGIDIRIFGNSTADCSGERRRMTSVDTVKAIRNSLQLRRESIRPFNAGTQRAIRGRLRRDGIKGCELFGVVFGNDSPLLLYD